MARKKSKKQTDPPEHDELEWLREAHADALDLLSHRRDRG
jgi:hypothetical protein